MRVHVHAGSCDWCPLDCSSALDTWHAKRFLPRVPMLAVAAAATTATVYLKEDFSGDCARLPLEPGVRCHRVSKPVLPWQGRAAGL